MKPIRFIAIGLKPNRIEALSDGLFAIVMTLLVIELAVPVVPELLASEKLGEALLEMWPRFLAFGISFLILGLFWFNHHIYFHFIRRSDSRFAWLNVLFLAPISLMPFSTALIGEYNIHSTLAVMFYGINGFACTLTLNMLWWYATGKNRLIDSDLDPQLIRSIRNRGIFSLILIVFAILIALINPLYSIIFYVLITIWIFIDNLAANPYRQGISNDTSKDSNKYSSLNYLEKLQELKKKGIITEEEFVAKKKLILGI